MKGCIFLFILGNYVGGNTIIIDPNAGENDINCLEGDMPCKDFSYVFITGVSYLNNTVVILNPSTFNISSHIEINFVYNLTIKSFNATLQCVGPENGITFVGSRIIEMKNVTIENCGAKHLSTDKSSKSKTKKQSFVYIALCFLYCQNISIQHLKFYNNSGRALSFYNVNKLIHVAHTVFKYNSNKGNKTKNATFISGGGIYIEYTLCNATEKYSCHEFPNYNKDTLINISYSIFHNNTAENMYGKKQAMTKRRLLDSYETFGRGGGICVNMFGYAIKNSVNIDSCIFNGNSANWGAGLSVTFKDGSDANSLVITNSTFLTNEATYAGGGVRVETLFNESFNGKKVNFYAGNFINLTNVEYNENSAIVGGGMSYLGSTRTLFIHNSTARDIVVDNNTFNSNKATIGYAMGLNTINMNKDILGPGMSIRMKIKNSVFNDNHFFPTEDFKVIGQGALYSDQFTLVFYGKNKLNDNNPTAIALDSSSLFFSEKSTTIFLRNYGNRGGALAMYGSSWLMFGSHSKILFQKNKASDQGGAIYIEPGVPPRPAFKTTWLSTKQCFFRYEYDMDPDEWAVNITFDNNYSKESSGNSIYALTAKHCRINEGSRMDKNILDWKPFTFINNHKNQSEIVTSAVEVKLNNGRFTPYPNLPYSPAVTILDEKNQSAYATLELRLYMNTKTSKSRYVFHIRDHIPGLRINGTVNKEFSYQFRSVNGLIFESKKSKNGYMKQCPPGYRPNDYSNSCICMDSENGDVLKCFEGSSTVLILNKKWGYLDKDNLLKLIQCPLHFCKCNGKLDMYKCALDLSNQCIENRNGNLCGICNEGYSVKLGNEECERCGNTNLYVMLSFIFIGIPIFIIFLLMFNCNVIQQLNAYLFSNQMLSIIFAETIQLDPFMSFIIGITSFTGTGGLFGICLYDGMDNISKLGINYVLPMSIIIFTWVIAKIVPAKLWIFRFGCRNCKKNDITESSNSNSNYNADRESRNFGRALCFVALLCYSSITNTSFRIIRYIRIKGIYYVYSAPGTTYFSYPHNILLAVACMLVLFISIGFPLMLCCEKKLSRYCRIFIYFSPIATALKFLYKENYQTFATFYFIVRFIILLSDVLLHNVVQKLIIFTGIFVISLAVFSVVQPYRLFVHNILDTIIITNLTILSLLSIIVNVPFAVTDSLRKYVIIFCQVFVWLPFAVTIFRSFLIYKRRYSRNNESINHSRGMVPYMPVRGDDSLMLDD